MNENLNTYMKMLMFEKCISNRELAKHAGISANSLSQILNGYVDPKLKVAQRIAKVLGTTTDELFPLVDVE